MQKTVFHFSGKKDDLFSKGADIIDAPSAAM